MVLALQWLLTVVGLFAGLITKRICQRFGIPQLPWRTPWIALLAHSTELTIESLRIPISARLDLGLITGILTSIAISRFLVWVVLEILPTLRILPSSPKILRDLIFIVGSLFLIAVNLTEQANIDLVGLVTTSAVLTAVVG